MPLSIYSNVASFDSQIRLGRTQTEMAKHMSHLSSGLRIAEASDDAGGLGVSQIFEAQVRSYIQAGRNTNDGISLLQTADGSLSQVHNILQRMRELSVQSANGTLANSDRNNIQSEFSQLQTEIDRIANSTKFGSISILDVASTVTLQVGANNTSNDVVAVSFAASTGATLKVDTGSLKVDTAAGATAAITALDTAIGSVSGQRATLGAQQNRLRVAMDNDQVFAKNLDAAVSRLRDADVAQESAALARTQVLAQAGIAVLAQANQAPNMALSLLRG